MCQRRFGDFCIEIKRSPKIGILGVLYYLLLQIVEPSTGPVSGIDRQL